MQKNNNTNPYTPPAIILVEPQLADNIGAAARAMANFGLAELRLVKPKSKWPNHRAATTAKNAKHIIDNAVLFPDTQTAIDDLQFVLATTARRRDMIVTVLSPENAAKQINQKAQQNIKTGILFGKEQSGLKNDDIIRADALITAKVDPHYASINLAQAVMIIAYECYKMRQTNTNLGRETPEEHAAIEGLNIQNAKPTQKKELNQLIRHLETELDHAGFLKPKEKKPAMMRNIRNIINRAQLTDQETRTLRGIISSLVKNKNNP